MDTLIAGLNVTPLRVIADERGEVKRGLRSSESDFGGFGELYFSSVRQGVVKGWKKHLRMHSNLIVIQGKVRFVVFDDRPESSTFGKISCIELSSTENYSRITIPANLWMAFQGLGDGTNQLANLASIEHDPTEALSIPINDVTMPSVDWSIP